MKIAIFEGPQHEKLKGWRHYLVAQFPFDRPAQYHSCASSRTGAQRMIQLMHARFFESGTWEGHGTIEGVVLDARSKTFPPVRPGVIAEILGKTQAELPI